MRPTIQEIENLAQQAGGILRSSYGQRLQVDHKGVIDLVTDVDRRSEAFLIDSIHDRFPDHRVVAEESGGLQGNPICTWIIDPLDGTVNYAHGVPIFAVSLAYVENNQVVMGVVYDPMLDECFSAELGKGAFLNGNPLAVSPVSALADSLLVTGFPYDIWHRSEDNLDHYASFTKCTQGVRRLGSAALDLAYVAAGRLDGYWELHTNPWDIAAGALIVQEAGGVVTAVLGGEDYLSQPCSILAANTSLHSLMLEVIRS